MPSHYSRRLHCSFGRIVHQESAQSASVLLSKFTKEKSCIWESSLLSCLQMEPAFFGTRRTTGLLQQLSFLLLRNPPFSPPPSSQISAPCHTIRSSSSLMYYVSGRDFPPLHTGLKYNIGCNRIVPCSRDNPQLPQNISGTI